MTFHTIVHGQKMQLTVPAGMGPGMMLQFQAPPPSSAVPAGSVAAAAPAAPTAPGAPVAAPDAGTDGAAEDDEPLSFEIPEGYGPGDKITIEVEGQQVELEIPEGYKAGDEMHFDMPK